MQFTLLFGGKLCHIFLHEFHHLPLFKLCAAKIFRAGDLFGIEHTGKPFAARKILQITRGWSIFDLSPKAIVAVESMATCAVSCEDFGPLRKRILAQER